MGLQYVHDGGSHPLTDQVDGPTEKTDLKRKLQLRNIELCISKMMAEMKVNPNNTSHRELLTQGIRAFHLEEFNTAVQALSQATEILVREHGDDVHDSLGDVYFYYGKSLLELARSEAQPLGDGIPKEADSDDEDDDEQEAGEEEQAEEGGEKMEVDTDITKPGASDEAAQSGSTVEAAKSSSTVEAAKSTVEAAKDSSTVEAAKSSSTVEASKPSPAGGDEAGPSTSSGEAGSSSAADEAGPSTSTGITEETTEDDEPSDLQVAWEVLELAKKIFTARGKAGELNLAETLIALGEISLENEKYEDAVVDMTQGLNIQKTVFEPDSRTLAETYYKLGVVFGTNTQLDQAMSCFNEALTCLKSKVAKLEAIEKKSVDDEMEIRDIKDLMPVIEEKIADMKSYKEEVRNGVNNLLKGDDSSSSTANGITEKSESKDEKTEKPTEVVNNISHLVKRKRPLESKDQDPDNYKPVEKQIC